jgi:outer membrane lipoprotein-sorting protein
MKVDTFLLTASTIVGIGALLAPAFAQQADLTLDQIVEKHTAALGGVEKLKAIETVVINGQASLMNGQMKAPLSLKIKRPTSMRMEMTVQGQSFIQAFDGNSAWVVNPFAGSSDPQKQSDQDAKTARDDADFVEGSLVDYKAKGNALELIGKEDVAGSPAYKIKVTKKGGTVEFEYIDAQTFLPVKSSGKREQQGQEIEYESTPANFKAVNGVMMPYRLSQTVNGQLMMELTVEKIEVNKPIDPAIFRMPEKAKEEKKDPPKG